MSEATGKVYPVHNNKFKFGTKGLSSVDGDIWKIFHRPLMEPQKSGMRWMQRAGPNRQ